MKMKSNETLPFIYLVVSSKDITYLGVEIPPTIDKIVPPNYNLFIYMVTLYYISIIGCINIL